MAQNDIITNTERVRTLLSIANSIKTISKACSEAQSYYENSTDFGSKNAAMPLRMANIKALVGQAANELDYLALDRNMEFQFEWRVGHGDLNCIKFGDGDGASSTDTITLTTGLAADAGYALADTFYGALATGDRIKVSGTTSNDGEYLCDVAGSPFVNVVTVAAGSFVAEECVTSGARITKVRNEA